MCVTAPEKFSNIKKTRLLLTPEKNILRFKTRTEWRKWLKQHFKKEKEAWLVSPNQSSGEKRIPYNDLVEEALCFGWIDSIAKSLDKPHSLQRYTPRRKGSSYSQPNIERLKHLISKKKIHPDILPTVQKAIEKKFIYPKDILAQLKKDKVTWKNYQAFSESYKRVRVAYIEGARKRPEEFQRRLMNFIEKTKNNKLIAGYGGVKKYY
jgi:uncharacterized protein YdeI (YjbR/CyaY-like superfamily)